MRSASARWPPATRRWCPPSSQELKKQGADDIIVFVGGVIPQQDYEFLYDAGVKGIYGPGTPIPASAKDVLEQIRRAQG
jgi:methylmalonyl-CoA mutase